MPSLFDPETVAVDFTLAFQPAEFALRVAGSKNVLTADSRLEMLTALRGGSVVELELDITSFHQTTTPRPLPKAKRKEANANHTRFREQDMAKFAASFAGKPFLRDHDRNDLLARGGTITKSELSEHGNKLSLSQTIKLVKLWAVEAALDGTLETFSIGWDPAGATFRARMDSINCTVCGCSMFSADCPHMPGDEHKVADSNEVVIVEAEFKGARGAEVSAVTFPAVQGTSIDSVKQALSQVREARAKVSAPRRKRMTPETLKRLGLTADATPEQIEAAVARMANDNSESATKLAAANATHTASQATIDLMVTEEKERVAKEAKTRVEALATKARADGLWNPGDEAEALFHELAAINLPLAEKHVASLKRANPLGAPMQSAQVPVTGVVVGDSLEEKFPTSPIGSCLAKEYHADELQVREARDTFRAMGITEEMFDKHGPHAVLKRHPDEPWLDDGAGSLNLAEVNY